MENGTFIKNFIYTKFFIYRIDKEEVTASPSAPSPSPSPSPSPYTVPVVATVCIILTFEGSSQ